MSAGRGNLSLRGGFDASGASRSNAWPMQESAQEGWFFTHKGERMGPVSLADLRVKANDGALDPRHDLVWGPGMTDWKPAGEVEGLFARRATEDAASAGGFAATGDFSDFDVDETAEQMLGREREWPGVKRFGYIVGSIAIGVVFQAVPPKLLPVLQPYLDGHDDWFLLATAVFAILFSVSLALRRFANLGMSGWWLLGTLVPILNWWVGYRLFACPPGYAMHKKMDGAGIALAILYWLGVALGLAVFVLFVAVLIGAAGSPEFQQKLKEVIAEIARQSQQAK